MRKYQVKSQKFSKDKILSSPQLEPDRPLANRSNRTIRRASCEPFAHNRNWIIRQWPTIATRGGSSE
jgi:hypothetical protein